MPMFQSRKKTRTEYTPMYSKDWTNSGAEIERLGLRLDAVRDAKRRSKRNSWAKRHWSQTEQIMLRKWKQTIRLRHVGLRQEGKINLGPKIDYGWWEDAEENHVNLPLFDWFYRYISEKVASPDLDRAWEMAREEKLQKARQGLA